MRLIYPFMKNELRLKWPREEIDDVTTAAIDALLDLKLLTKDGHIADTATWRVGTRISAVDARTSHGTDAAAFLPRHRIARKKR